MLPAPANVYRDFLSELKRIFGKEIVSADKEFIFQTYIYDEVSANSIHENIKLQSTASSSLLEHLNLNPILERTVEVLGILRLVDSWLEFEALVSKTFMPKDSVHKLSVNC